MKLSKKTIKEYSNEYEVVSTKDMTSRVLKVIKKITNKTPIKIPIRQKGMTSTGKMLACHFNVEYLVRNYGGERITGYYVSAWDNQIQLLPHSVWKTPEGKLVDVTARTDDQIKRNPSQDKSVCYFIAISNDPRTIVPQIIIPITTNKSMKGEVVIEKIDKVWKGEYWERIYAKKTPKVVKFTRKVDDIFDFYGLDSLDEWDWFQKVA